MQRRKEVGHLQDAHSAIETSIRPQRAPRDR
jgi:hypothetical protein